MKLTTYFIGYISSTEKSEQHTNNWAVLVSTSTFWFNYRHMANALSIYRTVKRLGIPDSNIILMLSDDIACNARNTFPGTVYNNHEHTLDLYGQSVEVDYRGNQVTVQNLVRVLTGRLPIDSPRSKRLLSDDRSNVLIYLTGHGGEDFLKFQDTEEISSQDIGDAIEQMREKKRYNKILFMVDTCQANSLYSRIRSPNVVAVGSSRIGENSYSYLVDHEVGVSLIDRFTNQNLQFMENIKPGSKATLRELFDTYSYEQMYSHAGIREDLFPDPLHETLITDFFGNVQDTYFTSTFSDIKVNTENTDHFKEQYTDTEEIPKFNENEYIQNTGKIQLGYFQTLFLHNYVTGLEPIKVPIHMASIFNLGSISLFVSLVCAVLF